MRQLRPLLLALPLVLGACGIVYKMDVNQGNLLEKDMVDSLKPGMTKRQVALVMGTPSIATPFDQDRWDYAASYSHRGAAPDVKNLTLFFENEQLARIEGDYFPQQDEALLEQSRRVRGIGPELEEERTKRQRRGSGG
jgi:outer membrane protein assembly factor BamE